MQALTTTRQERGQTIAQQNKVTQINETTYTVKSQSGHGHYEVIKASLGWMCSCYDHMHRGTKCKHIWAVEISRQLKEQVKKNKIIQELTVSDCIYCHSKNTKKFVVRHNKSGNIQRFKCLDCGKTFSVNIGFERMKHNPHAITTAMQLYFSGESLRNTMESLQLLGVQVSHQTVFNWIKKYVNLMKQYADKLVPNVSDTWRADEIRFKVRGNMKYLFSVMDDETRFWIAQEVADTKHSHDTQNLFNQSKALMGKQPKTIITDGLYSFAVAAEVTLDEAKHIRHVRLQGDMHNNKMERLNGEIRDREKTMRGIKTKNTDIFNGYQIFHNYIRPHEALDGKTPAEACGIEIEGKNKWVTLIQNATAKKENV
jgi:transposase-like protein